MICLEREQLNRLFDLWSQYLLLYLLLLVFGVWQFVKLVYYYIIAWSWLTSGDWTYFLLNKAFDSLCLWRILKFGQIILYKFFRSFISTSAYWEQFINFSWERWRRFYCISVRFFFSKFECSWKFKLSFCACHKRNADTTQTTWKMSCIDKKSYELFVYVQLKPFVLSLNTLLSLFLVKESHRVNFAFTWLLSVPSYLRITH